MTSGVAQAGCDLQQGWARQEEPSALEVWLDMLASATLLPSPRPPSPRASHQAGGSHTRLCSVARRTGKAWATCGPESEWIQGTGSHLGDRWPPGEWHLLGQGQEREPLEEKVRFRGGSWPPGRPWLGALGTIPQPGSRRGGGVLPRKSFSSTGLHFFMKPKTTSSSNREARDLSEDGTGPPPEKGGTWRKR